MRRLDRVIQAGSGIEANLGMTRRQPIRPGRLKEGDTVGITAPASRGDAESIRRSAHIFEEMGLKVRFGKSLDRQHGYLAGTDEERAAELNAMFADPEIKAIVCARGGYGSARIADTLDYDLIRAYPKILWGYSDITFLHAAIWKMTGLVSVHGPMLICLGEEQVHPLTRQSFSQLIQPVPFCYTEDITPLHTLVEGVASGPLVGGNLTLLTSTLGTPYEIDTRGCLLFIEDIGEEPYRIDRMLNQLRMAGKLDQAAGILVGDFRDCEPVKRRISFSLEEVIRHYVTAAGRPALSGFGIGHGSPNVAVPHGMEAVMSTVDKRIESLESAII